MLTTGRPLRVAVLCSRRAPGLVHLLDADPSRGRAYEIGCVITSERSCVDADQVAERGVAVLTHSILDFYEARGAKLYRDLMTRRAYDRATADLLAPYEPDVILLDGYLYLVTKPMLEAHRNRMLNLHFSDLTIRRADHSPAYAGIRAVRDALADGQVETGATVHLVNEQADGGAPIVRSWPYPVSPLVARARQWSAPDMLKAYAYAHQEWMIRGASGPLLSSALHLVASGKVDLDALSTRDPAAVTPWIVDEKGRMTPPGAMRMHEILRKYNRASA